MLSLSLLWMLERAEEEGAERFDFGGSVDFGLDRFPVLFLVAVG